jgi:choline kinase
MKESVEGKPSELRTALILAAGMGARLAGQHTESPKGFLVMDDKAIVEESIDKLVAVGIERVLIVTGHLAEYYEKLAACRPGLIETVHNSDYANSGSMYSLYCARHRVDTDFLLLESDLVYEKRALDVLLRGASPDAVLLSGPTHAGDEVYVQAPEGRLETMSKQRDELQSVRGELVGITRISASLYERMCELAAPRFGDTLHIAYETDGLVAAGADRAIHCPLVEDLHWGEIDDEAHLKRVREQVYPAIARLDD